MTRIISRDQRQKRALFTLGLAGLIFLVGVGLFFLKSIVGIGAQSLDVVMEVNLTVDKETVQPGEPFTFTVDYLCASFGRHCEGVIISETLPTSLSWDPTHVKLTSDSDHVASSSFDPNTGQVMFVFHDTLEATSKGTVQVETRFPQFSTQDGTVAANMAFIDLINGPSRQTEMVYVKSGVALLDENTPIEKTSLLAVEDTFVSQSAPTDNFNGQPLTFEYGTIFNEEADAFCPSTSKLVYLKFDLSEVAFEIDKARLNLSMIGGCEDGAAQALPVQLFASTETWAAETITWQNRPAADEILINRADWLSSDTLSWSDWRAISPDDSLAHWLANQQAAGTTTVTLGLVVDDANANHCSAEKQPSLNAVFQDSELSGTRAPACGGESLEPTLELAGAGGTLTNNDDLRQPTAIALETVSAETNNPSTLIMGAMLILGLISALIRPRKK